MGRALDDRTVLVEMANRYDRQAQVLRADGLKLEAGIARAIARDLDIVQGLIDTLDQAGR